MYRHLYWFSDFCGHIPQFLSLIGCLLFQKDVLPRFFLRYPLRCPNECTDLSVNLEEVYLTQVYSSCRSNGIKPGKSSRVSKELFVNSGAMRHMLSLFTMVFTNHIHLGPTSIPFACLFPPSENQFPLTEIQFPLTEIQFPLTEIQFPLTEIQFPLTEFQFPPTEIQFHLTENQ